jgi:hypothetical protein
MSDYNDRDFDKKFSEIMKIENIEDFDSFVKAEFTKSVKEYLLILSTINEFNQYLYTLLFSVLNNEPIELDQDMEEALSTIYKLSTDFIDYMVELTEDDILLVFDPSSDDEEEDEDYEDEEEEEDEDE